ncbi:hypothetical protein ACRRTK_011926 [Alexandromys fortis]
MSSASRLSLRQLVPLPGINANFLAFLLGSPVAHQSGRGSLSQQLVSSRASVSWFPVADIPEPLGHLNCDCFKCLLMGTARRYLKHYQNGSRVRFQVFVCTQLRVNRQGDWVLSGLPWKALLMLHI